MIGEAVPVRLLAALWRAQQDPAVSSTEVFNGSECTTTSEGSFSATVCLEGHFVIHSTQRPDSGYNVFWNGDVTGTQGCSNGSCQELYRTESKTKKHSVGNASLDGSTTVRKWAAVGSQPRGEGSDR